MRFTAILILMGLFTIVALGQRPRAVDTSAGDSTSASVTPAPQSMKAKYEGGVFGYNKKQDGTLVFDDPNSRLVFKNKEQKEVFFIPYEAVTQAFADTQSRRPAAASVVSAIPVPYGLNLPARFIKKKYQYLTMQFYDDNSHVGGVTSFKLENKALVESVVGALANKAGLIPRGQIFVRDRNRTAAAGTLGTASAGSQADKPAVFVENEMLSNRVINLPRPLYPEEARSSRASGTVRVLVTIDEQGRVAEAEVVSGPSVLQDSALNAAKQAVFEPLLRDGKPVRTKTVIAYNFSFT